jgi:plastocyanin
MRTNGYARAVLLGLSLALAACSQPAQPSGGGGGGGGGTSSTVSIPLTDYGGNQTPQFSPTNLTIAPGTSVNWRNNDTVAHTTTSDDNLWNSNIAPGGSYSRQFSTAGTFTYSCTVHPGMTGRVVVQ